MPTVDEILAVAARLDPDQLRDLKQGIVRLERQARSLVLTAAGQAYRLARLDDFEFRELWRRSIAIEEDLGFSLQFFLYLRSRGEEMNFAEIHAALAHLSGDSGTTFDDYKGSFSFPFALQFDKAGQEQAYLLEVRNCRDSLYFPFRKLVAADDERLRMHAYHPPIAGEFSRDEMNRFMVHFYGYLQGGLKVLSRSGLTPFVCPVPASWIVYGYCGGAFFERQYESEEDYQAALESFREQVNREKAGPADPCAVVNS